MKITDIHASGPFLEEWYKNIVFQVLAAEIPLLENWSKLYSRMDSQFVLKVFFSQNKQYEKKFQI